MKQITTNKFKEKYLVINKQGKPIAKLVSFRNRCVDLIGSLKGKIKIKGDVLYAGLHWNAQS